MRYINFLLITLLSFFSHIAIAETDMKIFELQTKDGIQKIQIQERNEVFLPQEIISISNADIKFNDKYTRSLSQVSKNNGRFVNIGTVDENTNIETVCRNFLEKNYEQLSIDHNNLQLKKAEFAGNRWYVIFYQIHNGISVKSSSVRFTIAKNGNIQTFEATYFDDINLSADKPSVSTLECKQAAIIGLSSSEENYNFKRLNNDSPVIVPYLLNGKYSYRLAYEYEVTNMIEFYTALIDAKTGALLSRYNHTNEAFAKGDVYNNPNAPLVNSPIGNATFSIAGKNYISNRNGSIDLPAGSANKQFTTNLSGKFAKMYTTDKLAKDGSTQIKPYSFTGTVNDDGINMIGKTDNFDEVVRTLYYHTNFIHDYITNIDGQFNAYLTEFPCIVELLPASSLEKITGITFNAFSSGDKSISFYAANHNIILIGRLPAVIYHEYGHSINYVMYSNWSKHGRMISTTCNEALADITAAFALDSPDIFANAVATGYEQYLSRYNLTRNLDNDYTYPEILIHECHHDSQVLSGALWDLRKAIGIEMAELIVHFARREAPDAFTLDAALANWFEAVVKAADGGMGEFLYFDEILQAFDRHKIGFNLLAKTRFEHKGTDDSEDLISLPIVAQLPELYMPKQVEEVFVNYYTNWDSEVQTIALTKNGDTYEGKLPKPDKVTRYYYYFTMKNPYNGELIRSPRNHIAFVGYKKLYENNCETIANWEVANENNTERGWINKEPTYAFVSSPEALLSPIVDHTTGQGKCWRTGYEVVNYAIKTLHSTSTLTSPTITFSGEYPVFSYYYYLLNTNTYSGSLKIEFSFDNGQTWVLAKEYSKQVHFPEAWTWKRDFIHIKKFAGENPNYSNMKVRFVAFGNSTSGYFTFFVDDIAIYNTDTPGSIDVDKLVNNITISPNPASYEAELKFNRELINPEINVIDALGNIIYSIKTDGNYSTFPLNVNNLESGVYFLQINSGKTTLQTNLTVIK